MWAVLAWGVVALCCLPSDARGSDKPNIIVIFTDDHGYSDLSCQGFQEDIRTPNIDALAQGGVRMESGYVTAPQCVPSRAGLMTGQYQNRFGVESNGESLEGFNGRRTIAQRLKAAGYATGMTGKWHLGPAPEITQHGFDDVYYKNANRPGWANFDLEGNDRPGGPEQSEMYHLDANSAAACAFIRRHHDEPFFFYCAYRAPHVPLDAPPKYLDRFPGDMPQRRRQALAMISAIDDGVGRIIQTLRTYGLEEKTLIFLIGDNGAPLKIHKLDAPGGGPGWDGSLNDPLNGEKGMLTEGGIRVPFVVYWKDHIPGGQVYREPVISLDVTATAVALAGLPADPQLDGVNLIPFLTGERQGAPHEALFWRWIAQSAVREGRWKYLRGGSREYLFDVVSDREEKHNLIKEHPEIAARLKGKLENWASSLDPPGLATKPMSSAADQYFDYYLDGKPAPRPSAGRTSRAASGTPAIQGWIARNATIQLSGGTLHVRSGRGKAPPFIAANGLQLPARVTVIAQMSVERDSEGHVAWREAGQSDFSKEQVVSFACRASSDPEEYRVTIPAARPVIHVRLILPRGEAEIASITFQDGKGHSVRSWDFGQ